MYSHRFFTAFSIVILLTRLCGCGGKTPTPSSPSRPSSGIQISETGYKTATTTFTQSVDLCAGGSSPALILRQTFTVEVEGSLGGTVGIEAAKASVTAKYGEGKVTTLEQQFPWPPKTHTRLTITWTWQEWTGDLFTDSGPGKFVAHLPIDVKLEPVDLGCPVMDVSGVWLTPFNNLSYSITQDQTKVRLIVRESGVNGTGTIEGKTFVADVGGQKVVYEVGEWDSKGNPTVLNTFHPDYFAVVLFRTCDDFGKFVTDVGKLFDAPTQTQFYNLVKSLPNPKCPNVLH